MNKIVIFLLIILTLFLVTACCLTKDGGDSNSTSIDETNDFEIVFTPRDDMNKEAIRIKDEKLPFTIYTYGGDVQIIIEGITIPLAEALENNETIIDKVINKATIDSNDGTAKCYTYRDGGSIIYIYPDYSIIKCNKLDGNRDLYIGKPGMDINDLA